MSFAEGTPTATISLDKERTIACTIGAMRRMKELGVMDLDENDEVGTMIALPKLIWACLEEEGRKALSVQTIEELMHPGNMRAIASDFFALFGSSVPRREPEGNGAPAAEEEPTAGKSTSTSSGQSASTTSG